MVVSPKDLAKALERAGVEVEPNKTISNQVASINMEGFVFSPEEIDTIRELLNLHKNDYDTMVQEVIAKHENIL